MLLERNATGGKEGKARQGQGKAVFREVQLHFGFDTKPRSCDGSFSPITLRKPLTQGFLVCCKFTRFACSIMLLQGPGF